MTNNAILFHKPAKVGNVKGLKTCLSWHPSATHIKTKRQEKSVKNIYNGKSYS